MKLRRKVFMSAAALAACAATLTTTTYAWYVTNDTASVGTVTGSSASAEASGNLLVAQDEIKEGEHAAGVFTTKLTTVSTYTQATRKRGEVDVPGLLPVSKDTTGESGKTPESGATGWHDADLNPVATTAAYSEFSFWIKSTNKTEINVALLVKNITETFKDQTLYNTSGAPTGVKQGDPFHMDAVDALRMEVFQGESYGAATGSAGTVIGVKAFQKGNKDSHSQYTTLDGCATGGDANAYYDALMGENAAGGTTVTEPETAFNKITVTANTDTILVFRFWLEGTDADCFDSCVGQTFTFDFLFDVQGK